MLRTQKATPYNHNAAHVCYLAGHIESCGRRIEKLFDSCKENDEVKQV